MYGQDGSVAYGNMHFCIYLFMTNISGERYLSAFPFFSMAVAQLAHAALVISHLSCTVISKMALLCSAAVRAAPLRLCFYLLFYLLLISIFTHITSALITYDKSALLDIGNRFTNLVQDTLSPNPSWPLEILRNAENKGHRRRNKKHRGKSAGIRNRLRKRAHSPPLPSLLLANVQSLDNKMDDLRARISFQRDIRDCNIICLTETWLTPSVPDTAVTPSDNFSVLRMDRTAEAGKSKGGGVCFMTNKKWCDPRNISSLSRSCSPHLEHLSIICRPFYLPREFSAVIATAVYIPPQADTSLALSKLHDVISGYINQHPDAAFIIAGILTKPTSGRSCRTFTSMYPVQPEDRIHWITATLSLRTPTRPVHYLPLVSLTTPPSSSHRNTDKGSHRNPRWRGKWRVGPPTLKLCCSRLLMTSTGTCSGRAHLTSASSRRWQWAL